MAFETVLLTIAIISCLIWVYLLVFNGFFWLSDQRILTKKLAEPSVWPSVVAIIPARDEAQTIGAVLKSHLASRYPGDLAIIVVDDQSSDGTGTIVDHIADGAPRPVFRVAGSDLPCGWSGKLWAIQNGLKAAADKVPDADYVLFTDADIVHGRETLKRLVMCALGENRALVSVMAMLDARGIWGNLLIPPFIFFFQKLYPFRRVNDPASSMAGAAGGCVLVEREALSDSGGIEAIQGTLIDDCALADRIKNHGSTRRSIWLGFDPDVKSLRDNRSFSTIWKMVARTAFTQLRFSSVLLSLSVVGMFLTYLAAPFTFLLLPFHGSGVAFSIATWAYLFMIIAFLPTLLLYRKSPFWALFLPLSALLYLAMTVSSALAHWRGVGGHWKGRTYG